MKKIILFLLNFIKKLNFYFFAFLFFGLNIANSQEIFKPNVKLRQKKEVNFTLPFFPKSQKLNIEMVEGYAIFEGDIILDKNSLLQNQIRRPLNQKNKVNT